MFFKYWVNLPKFTVPCRKDILSEDSLTRQRDIAKEERKLKAIKQKVLPVHLDQLVFLKHHFLLC